MSGISESTPQQTRRRSSDGRRALAKQHVAERWASARRQSLSTSTNKTTSTYQYHHQQQPSLCFWVRNIWMQSLASSFSKQQPLQQTTTATTKESSSILPNESIPRVFESVTRQHVARSVFSNVVSHDDSVAQVLPAGYDFPQAMERMSQSRKRAFLLLDLAAVVTSHVRISKLLRNCQLQYVVGLNRDEALLQLLGPRLGTSLRCNSNMDVAAAAAASSSSSCQEFIVDHAGVTRKPNGFLKRLANYTSTFAVDGPEEVDRIHNVLKEKKKKSIGFILKLPKEVTKWSDLMECTQDACHSRNATLDGVAVHIRDQDVRELKKHLLHACARIHSNNSNKNKKFRIDVTGIVSLEYNTDIYQFLLELSKQNFLLTVDVSHLLVANAGALCTRIIGVKRLEHNNTIHYYIDDGCYGSLQNGNCSTQQQEEGEPAAFHPTFLLASNDGNDNDQQELYTCTVWGPTCDGLDRVCQNVQLPSLKVNDWLVFPNLGCGGFGGGLGLGTAFNGFEPPDIVYCVLGYF